MAASPIDAGPNPWANDPASISRILRTIYTDGPLPLRLLQVLRPFLCPFERLFPYIPPQARALDAGCGGGLLLGILGTLHLISSGVGFDPSPQAITVARGMAARIRAHVLLEFRIAGVEDEWPSGPFDLVLMIDVLHHLAEGIKAEVFKVAASRLQPGGTLLMKDIGSRPRWKAAANTLHDLVLARQLVSYSPLTTIDSWATDAGLERIATESPHRLWYSHEIRVYRKPLEAAT